MDPGEAQKNAYERAHDYSRKAHDKAAEYGRKARSDSSYRKTIAAVLSILAVLVCAGIAIPYVLPSSLASDEAIIGRDGGIAILNLTRGTFDRVLPAPGKDESYATWALSGDRTSYIVAWLHKSAGAVDKATIQLRSAYTSGLRWEYSLDPGTIGEGDLQIGFVPNGDDMWVLSKGHLQSVDDRSGKATTVDATTVEGRHLYITGIAFSPDGKRVAVSAQGSNLAFFKGGTGVESLFASGHPEFFGERGDALSMCWLSARVLNGLGVAALPAGALTSAVVAVPEFPPVELDAMVVGVRGVKGVTRDIGEWRAPVLTASPDRKSFAVAGSTRQGYRIEIFTPGSSKTSAVKIRGEDPWRGPLCWSAP
jgi:hypothetical protein